LPWAKAICVVNACWMKLNGDAAARTETTNAGNINLIFITTLMKLSGGEGWHRFPISVELSQQTN
jgi:hypothetical protein